MTAKSEQTNAATALPERCQRSWLGTPAEQLRMFGWVTLFSSAIGVLLDSIGMSESLTHSLIISNTVGWSIFGTHATLGSYIEPRFGPVITSALATLVGLCIAIGLIALFLTSQGETFEFISWGSIATVLFFGPLGSVLFTNLSRISEMRAELSEAALEQSETERQLADSRLKTLQAQIEPHFLFNTLSASTRYAWDNA